MVKSSAVPSANSKVPSSPSFSRAQQTAGPAAGADVADETRHAPALTGGRGRVVVSSRVAAAVRTGPDRTGPEARSTACGAGDKNQAGPAVAATSDRLPPPNPAISF